MLPLPGPCGSTSITTDLHGCHKVVLTGTTVRRICAEITSNPSTLTESTPNGNAARQTLTALIGCRGIRGKELHELSGRIQLLLPQLWRQDSGQELIKTCVERAVGVLLYPFGLCRCVLFVFVVSLQLWLSVSPT